MGVSIIVVMIITVMTNMFVVLFLMDLLKKMYSLGLKV